VHCNHRRTNKQGWTKVQGHYFNFSKKWMKQKASRIFRRVVSKLMALEQWDELPRRHHARVLWGCWN